METLALHKILRLQFKLFSFLALVYLGIPEFVDSGRKSWTLETGRWNLDSGHWTLDCGR